MRVIAGSAKGRKLKTLEGLDVRPTTDKVKEAIFSAIQFDLPGAVVLDLFAGSGQMGIEALSRGAETAVFVDRSARSLQMTKENLESVQLAAQGLYIGFGGACTFNGAKRAAKAIEALPLDAIVLETDCPYMAPEPVRGTRCDSSLIRYVGTYIAQRKALEPEEVFRTTAANARRVFGL